MDKKTWGYWIGFAFLVLSVVPAFAQADASAPESRGRLAPASAGYLILENLGIPQADAQTAALLVRTELRKQGIAVGDLVSRAPAGSSGYRLVLGRLGEKIVAHLIEERPIGTVITERKLLLASIEEMVSAAPRLVDALVHRKPIAATTDIENITEQEARAFQRVPARFAGHLGFLGVFVPGTKTTSSPGMEMGVSYETLSYSVGSEIRFNFIDDSLNLENDFWLEDVRPTKEEGDDAVHFFCWSISLRRFFNKQNISPYVGAGGGIIVYKYYQPATALYTFGEDRKIDTYIGEVKTGMDIHAIFGVEALRFTKTRLRFELRVDFISQVEADSAPYLTPVTMGLSLHRFR